LKEKLSIHLLIKLLCLDAHVTDDAEDDYNETVADVDNIAIGNHYFFSTLFITCLWDQP